MLTGFLLAAALMPGVHAAPNCVMKLPDGSAHAGAPVYDKEWGHCTLWEVFDPGQNGGLIGRITYDSGKVQNIRVGGAAGAFRFDTQGRGFFQMGGVWPSNEYTRHLPDPGVAQEKAFGISVGVERGMPDSWLLVATWFKHDEDVFRQLTDYPKKLKRMGFSNVIRNHELDNSAARDEKFPPDALMAFSYSATNSAGYCAEVECGRPLPPGRKKAEAPPLAATVMMMPRMLPCTISLSSPTRARQDTKKESARKEREEQARKDGENRRKISDDFFNDIDKAPG